MGAKLVVLGAALALGTFLVLTGIVDLVGVLTRPLGGRLLVVVVLAFVALPWALGSLLLSVGWRGWRRARSH